jgi:hypothetical protein
MMKSHERAPLSTMIDNAMTRDDASRPDLSLSRSDAPKVLLGFAIHDYR